ncbi:MAG TPA: protease pro-enzyme activation domain-containing protein, partial [Terriglobales bacterium]|nr:protease pro-enzyme activation domain-containing protein [Terriglobales bacterium]
SDVAKISVWLQMHGMEIEEVTAGRRVIVFSGTAAQVASAFHTQIHAYKVGDELHHANATDPKIPAALAQVVGGVLSLHDFRSKPAHGPTRKPVSDYTSGGGHYLAPADFAVIYDLAPLYLASITGSGESVAIVARSNIYLSDVRQFRSFFGLPANDPQIIVNGADPGIWNSGEETEADLDVEWSGAIAKSATIQFVVSKSTNSSDGVDLSAQYIVNHNLAPVMSTSFGLCEAALGSSGNSFLNSLWQQAASQGITVLVSSGDNGAAGCDSASSAKATHGLGVNGLCSTPYSVCVGGTEFNDTSNASLYWSSSNASGTQASAFSYIPEVVWNESGSALWAGGGGASAIYPKPSWQTGAGVPADGKRDVPDVALSAAGHDGYLIYQNGAFYIVGGTSGASPSFAGIVALAVQHAAARQGNANTVFYALANKQRAGGATVFHDITTGNNSVPGQTGFSATPGYDQATGLGSVDASVLVNHWADATAVPAFQLTASATSVAVIPGSNSSITMTVVVSGGFNAAIAFSVSGLPSGLSGSFTSATLSAPGSGSSVLKLTAASSAAPGVYSATITANGSGVTQRQTLTVNVPGFSLTPSVASVTVSSAAKGTMKLTTATLGGFSSSVAFSVSGLPTGITASFSLQTLSAPGSGSSTLTLTKGSGAVAKSSEFTVTATGASLTRSINIGLTVK